MWRKIRLIVIGLIIFLTVGTVAMFADREDGPSSEVFTVQTADAKSTGKSDYDLSSIVILTRVISYIRNYYYDPGRINPEEMFKKALEEVARSIPSVMVDFDKENRQVRVKVDTMEKVFDFGKMESIWKIQYQIADIFSFIQPHLEANIDPKDVEYAAINGMLDYLDPHSVHLSPRIHRELKLSTKGNFGGLGIQIGLRDGNLTIISPISGTPAWRAGLKAKDEIEMIDGQSTINMSLDEAVQLMRGQPGTPCKLSIMRKGFTTPQEFEIIRDIIKIQSVNAKLLPGRIGYMQVKNFQGNTVSDMQREMEKFGKGGSINGLILDLRGNPGGLLESAIKMSDMFLDTGVIVTTVGAGNDPIEVNRATLRGTQEKYPIAVLVGSSSASASEIVAGALKNNNRAVVIGDRTFGKGSVQIIYDMEDGSALKLTVAQYLTPGDVSIQSVGITPDIELLPVYIEEDMIDFYASEKMGRERDLERHLQHKSTIEDKPFEKLRYLYQEKRDELDVDAPPEAINTDDFTIQTALKLIRNVGNISRREIILQRSTKLLKKIQNDEETKIVKRFKDFKVDWSLAPEVAGSTVDIDITADKPEPLPAGETVKLTLKMKNTGPHPYYRLRAITDSDNPILDGVEFFIGHLKPGEEREWTTKVEIPKSAYKRTDEVVFRFFDAAGQPPNQIIKRFTVGEFKHPAFAFTYQVVDTEGNGDGRIQKGETVNVLLDVENIGEGPVVDGLAILKNTDNLKSVFISEGRVKFDPIKPGEKSSIRFTFRVENDIEETSFPMELSIMDMELRDYVSDKLELKIEDPLELTPANGGLSLPAGSKIFGSPNTESQSILLLSTPTILPRSGDIKGWHQVRLAGNHIGWVPQGKADAFVTDSGVELPVQMILQTPKIVVDNFDSLLYTEKDSIEIDGFVNDNNHLQDMYMLCNGHKVYFKSNKSGSDPLSMRFDATFNLEEGANRISIVARESEDFTKRKVFSIYRKKSSHELNGSFAYEH